MKEETTYYKECHIAGRQYHEADEVWDELHIGTPLRLRRDAGNRYDADAIEVVYQKNTGDKETEDYVLGYIPKADNTDLARFLDMGYDDIFTCRLSRVDESAHYEQQLHVIIRLRKKQ